jgi:trans-aconitate methyltransferase
MTERPSSKQGSRELVEIDTSVPNAARVYDYLLGGDANFAVDREAAERNNAVLPGGIAAARAEVRANRDFLGRAVRHLAGEAGIRQFLDIGTGIPNADNVHAIAQQVAPESRVVCVDYDPVVLAHAHTLLKSTPQGAATYIHGDFRDPEPLLAQAADTLDLGQPVGLMLLGLLYLFPDNEPYRLVTQMTEKLAPGSYLAVSHITADFTPEMHDLVERLNENMLEPFTLRTKDEIERFFDGFELIEPGMVPVDLWPAADAAPAGGHLTAYYAGIGRKP